MNCSAIQSPDESSAIRIVDQRAHGSLQVGPGLPDGTLGSLKPLLPHVPEPNGNDARISPDGRLPAYRTDNLGQLDVFLTRLPDGEGQWQDATAGGRSPRWARDSGELCFVVGSGLTSRGMVAARVGPSQNSPLGALTPLENGTLLDADGELALLPPPDPSIRCTDARRMRGSASRRGRTKTPSVARARRRGMLAIGWTILPPSRRGGRAVEGGGLESRTSPRARSSQIVV